MKQAITKRLSIVIAITMLFVLILNLLLQVESAHEHMVHSADATIDRIEAILATNSEDMKQLNESLKEAYIVRARAVAYVLGKQSQLEHDVSEMRKLAELLQVDEICLFDTEGTIYGGSHPEYNGLTMFSGEQISFFVPMLSDRTMALCQDVTHNTRKPMMYAAVWREDGSGIVQVGLEPRRILESMERNEVRFLFSNLTMQENTFALALSAEDGMVIASTREELLGESMQWIVDIAGVDLLNYFYANIDGTVCSCVFRECGDQFIGVIWENRAIYGDIFQSMLRVLLYLGVAAVMMIAAILRSIDNLVIDNINTINDGLSEISEGKLDTRIHVDTLPEFVDLSSHINQMTESLLNTTVKITHILDATDAQVGFFEYNSEKKSVLTTRKLAAILAISPMEMAVLAEDKEKFRGRIDEIRSRPVPRCKNIYSLPTETACYVKLEFYEENGTTFGIAMDITEEIVEKERLRHERDHDLLTQLLCRRSFYHRMDDVFAEPEKLGEAAMLMFDLDGLKGINDSYGHAGGDKAIREAADLLSGIRYENKIVARLSGDEFAVFLYGAHERSELQQHIDDLCRRMLCAEVTVFGQVIPVRLSGGYVFYPEYNEGYTALLRMADQALYHSKKTGKSHFSVFCEDYNNIETIGT